MSANDKQVAGTHYQNKFQHWDLAHVMDLGYFEGQISKYVTRHRAKKGKEDLEKALHFAQKLLELAKSGRTPRHRFLTEGQLDDFVAANLLNLRERIILHRLFDWQRSKDIEVVAHFITELIVAEYGEGPGPGYVNQG